MTIVAKLQNLQEKGLILSYIHKMPLLNLNVDREVLFIEGSLLVLSETLPETIESGPLCITDLFQNKSVAYF